MRIIEAIWGLQGYDPPKGFCSRTPRSQNCRLAGDANAGAFRRQPELQYSRISSGLVAAVAAALAVPIALVVLVDDDYDDDDHDDGDEVGMAGHVGACWL